MVITRACTYYRTCETADWKRFEKGKVSQDEKHDIEVPRISSRAPG